MFLTMLFLLFLLKIDMSNNWINILAAICLSSLLITTRYEGVFLVLISCALLLLKRRTLVAALIFIAALLPIFVYGLWSMTHGWFFLPNSLLLKGNLPGNSIASVVRFLGYDLAENIYNSPHLLILIVLSLASLAYSIRTGGIDKLNRESIVNIIFIGATLLHLQFARTGWLFRYEAYLMSLGILAVGVSLNSLPFKMRTRKLDCKNLPMYAVSSLLACIILFPFFDRTILSLVLTPLATNNIYQQQYQMGLFLKRFYQGRSVAVNDIGAVTYLADIHLLDLWGLGSLEPAIMKMEERYSSQEILRLTQSENVVVAIVYDSWFQNGTVNRTPQQWVRVGQWTINHQVVAADDTVSIYAVRPSEVESLANNLKRFSVELPSTVIQYGRYVE
ncbi:hypothetical protein [Candidatus Chloroploca asiatica]|uniref:hypothetical protein n=1 Tax=Candidatus Chloroploca asiatica TaxID=1506545 RepID=UPI001141B3A9|nr:hypothetical protein [Candidatus Chloroploca asiatica]